MLRTRRAVRARPRRQGSGWARRCACSSSCARARQVARPLIVLARVLATAYAHPRFIMLTILIALLLAAVEADRAGSVDVIGAVPAISSEGALRFRQREP